MTMIFFLSFFYCFFLSLLLLKRLSFLLPRDRGKLLSVGGEASKGKPTGTGLIFIGVFLSGVLLFIRPDADLYITAVLIFFAMLFGYLDDRSQADWGEYRKGAIDLILAGLGAFAIMKWGDVQMWLPLFMADRWGGIMLFPTYTALLWLSVNTTNCSDGVDGLSGLLVLVCLGALSGLLWFILGDAERAASFSLPYIRDGRSWAVMSLSLAGAIAAYLRFNFYPGRLLMGDAGSRGLGFAVGMIILKTGNPLLFLLLSTVILINGGTGLVKVALKRFLNISIFTKVRFPLHDHMKEKYSWSAARITVNFSLWQIGVILVSLLMFF